MSTTRPFAYNTGAPISGTIQVGDLAVGFPTSGFTGIDWWNGPDEDLGYVIAQSVSSGNQPTNVPEDQLFLSPTYKGIDISLTNNNQTASQIFSYQQTVLGETIISGTNRVMFSVQYTSTNPSVGAGGHFIGVGLTTMNYSGPFNGYPGNDTNSIGFSDDGKYYYNGSVVTSGLPTWTNGDTIDIAISHGQYWWIRVNGGDWNNNPSADPTSLANGLTMSSLTNYYPALCPYIYGTMEVLNYPKYEVPATYEMFTSKLAGVGFFRTDGLDDNEFIGLTNTIFDQSFTAASDASIWLTTNGYWNSYPCLGIATNGSGGLGGWNPTAFDITPNPAIGTTYPVGSQITFQNGEIRTIIQIDDYSPTYIDIFYDTPISTTTLFPITICS